EDAVVVGDLKISDDVIEVADARLSRRKLEDDPQKGASGPRWSLLGTGGYQFFFDSAARNGLFPPAVLAGAELSSRDDLGHQLAWGIDLSVGGGASTLRLSGVPDIPLRFGEVSGGVSLWRDFGLSDTMTLSLGACGNLSNEDIAFAEALPRTGDLHVQIPAQAPAAASSALSTCTLGEAQQWLLGARDTGDKLNLAVDALLGIIDAIRHASPTSRRPDLRIWSFPDSKHPGVQLEASMLRVAQSAGATTAQQAWSFAIDARRGSGPYLEVLYAYFVGSEARTGLGEITI